jgi:hypothetical protein
MVAVQVDEDDLLDLGLGRSIYSKAQVEESLKLGLPGDQKGIPCKDCRDGL